MDSPRPEKSTAARVVEELAAGVAAPLGLWLFWQLQDETSWLRIRIMEARERAEEWSIRQRVEQLIRVTRREEP